MCTALDLAYGYDARNKVATILDGVDAAEDRGFTYDLKGRLLTASGPWGAGTYDYDGLDNIREKTLGARTVRVSFSRDTADGWIYRSWGYDGRGNTTTDGIHTFTYDEANQPVTATGGSAAASYAYDGDLKRVKSVVWSDETSVFFSTTTAGSVSRGGRAVWKRGRA